MHNETQGGWIGAGGWLEHARRLAADGWQLVDLCGVDKRDLPHSSRFEVVVQLVSFETKERQSLHIVCEGDDEPTVPSVVEVWPTADFPEREAFDMYGIRFEGHPNLVRIFMPDDWEGYPLRRDYGVGKVPVEFIPQPFLEVGPPSSGEPRELDALGQTSRPQRAGATDDLPGSGS